jgi:hypothetical protein
MATQGYDPKKAATYNQLKQQGLTENQAREQAGISRAERKNYMVNEVGSNDPKDASYNPNYGKMGPQVMGQNFQDYNKAVASGKTEEQAYAELQAKNTAAASDREFIRQEKAFLDEKQGKPPTSDGTNQEEFERAAYPINAKTPPNQTTVTQNFSNQTSSVSGGGTTTRYAGVKQDNAASNSAQKEANAKQAQLDKFYDDNPDPQERAAQGLPPLSRQEEAARKAQINELSNEKTALENKATDLKTSVPGGTVFTPNTTTTKNTETYEQINSNTPVNAPTGADPALNQQVGTQLVNNNVAAGSITNEAANVNVIPGGGQITDPNAPDYNANAAEFARDREEFVQNDAPAAARDPFSVTPRSLEPGLENSAAADVSASQDSGLLTPAQSIARAQTTAPADVPPANTGVFANPNFSPEAVSGVNAPVDRATDPGVKSPFGGSASNAAAARNPEAAAAALQQEQANQAAAMKLKAQQEAAVQAQFQAPANGDWRVRLRLAPGATYLYKDKDVAAGILAPLAASNGVVFPYMPTIQTTYNADYDNVALTHSNYRGQFYKSSYVGDVSITGTFTAQDTAEANYLLAVIHFFRSVTKMFYGAKDPLRGAPPPLVYLIGLGQYQFNNQPCVVKTFNYSMPNDCDYIRTKPNNYNTNLSGRETKPQTGANPISSVISRLTNGGLSQGALPNVPAQGLLEMQSVSNIADSTYVPTKCEIQLTLMPIQTRSQQSQQFNMQNFANGNLLKGGFW